MSKLLKHQFLYVNREETLARDSEKSKMSEVFSADGVPIHFQVQGQGEPALVFIHGWCMDLNYWDKQVAQFQGKHTVAALDLAGHGDSGIERKDWSVEAYSKDVEAAVKNLGLDSLILIGHSLGGLVMIEAALRMQERIRGLIGVDTLVDFEMSLPQDETDEWIEAFRRDFVQSTEEYVRSLFPKGADPDLVEQVVADMVAAQPKVGIGTLQGFFDYYKYKLRKAAWQIKVPLICINSDMNPPEVEINRKYIPSFKAKIMAGVGHFPMVEDPETLNRLLEEAIGEISSG
jgi:pimeloyl-ACP methyl ester carboxylesterase